MGIEIVTFTGIDAHTDLERLKAIGKRYPDAEFGVLLGSRTNKDDNGIFPPLRVIDRMRSFDGVRTSLHMCGVYSRGVMKAEDDTLAHLAFQCEGFNRVQVNLHADAWTDAITVRTLSLERFAMAVPCDTVILQHRAEWLQVPIHGNPKIEYLFDRSEGRGEEGFEAWPRPIFGLGRLGYAGGLGPHNINRAVAFANEHEEKRLWFDMEGKIRRLREDGLHTTFDLDAVERVCGQVWPNAGATD